MRTPWFSAPRVLHVLLLSWALAAAGCGPLEEGGAPAQEDLLGQSRTPVVYGTDDRTDVYAHTNATLRALAQQSTVALMNPGALDTSNPDRVTFVAQTLRSVRNLCSTERFLDDPTPAFCSGTLIDDDLVLTAGHCIPSASDCTHTRFVFNFYRTGATALRTVTTADLFSCQSIVARQQATVNGRNLDYAIIRLDRAATPRFTPAPIRPGHSPLPVGTQVTVIGSGSGIPFKIDSGGTVRDSRPGPLDYFVANTDTFGGSSGSGVYENGGYTVAGILVRGETDYVPSGSCSIVNVCSETGCRGEDITYVRPAIEAYCAVAGSQRLCGTPPNTLSYSASSTNSALMNTVNKTVALTAGQRITVATCGLPGASFTGDTWLRLLGPNATEVASNDDGCGGRGSSLAYTAAIGGNYEIRAGCYATESCSGTVVWEIVAGPPSGSGTYGYSAANTLSAQQNTVNQGITVAAGQIITLGTCGLPGASFTGDTWLRLYDPSATQVGSNDDACNGLGSQLTVTATTAGTYQIRGGCYDTTSCTGTVAWTVQ